MISLHLADGVVATVPDERKRGGMPRARCSAGRHRCEPSIPWRATVPERAEKEGKERSCAIAFLFGHSKRLLQRSSISTPTVSASLPLAALASTFHPPEAGHSQRILAWHSPRRKNGGRASVRVKAVVRTDTPLSLAPPV